MTIDRRRLGRVCDPSRMENGSWMARPRATPPGGIVGHTIAPPRNIPRGRVFQAVMGLLDPLHGVDRRLVSFREFDRLNSTAMSRI